LEVEKVVRLEDIFGISMTRLECGLKYLGFYLKPNDYEVSDWIWLLHKIEKGVGH